VCSTYPLDGNAGLSVNVPILVQVLVQTVLLHGGLLRGRGRDMVRQTSQADEWVQAPGGGRGAHLD
jgi:hypothetical protein